MNSTAEAVCLWCSLVLPISQHLYQIGHDIVLLFSMPLFRMGSKTVVLLFSQMWIPSDEF